MTRHTARLSLAIAGFVALGGLAGCGTAQSAHPTPPHPSSSSSTHSVGAFDAEGGFIVIGDGAHTVDVYVDALCPYCKLFETLNGDFLTTEAEAGNITLRLHPVSLLDRLSEGTQYSTRAAAMLAAVAETNPDQITAFITAVFEAQPGEHTEGLTNEELVDLAVSVGATAPAPERVKELHAIVTQNTERARNGQLSKSAGPLTHVPTVLINGSVFEGNSNDFELFHQFYAQHTS